MAAVALLALAAALALLALGAACAAEVRVTRSPLELTRREAEGVTPGRGPAGTVKARPRPGYEAVGLPFWGFRLHPTVTVSASVDSNIYRSSTDAEGDLIGRVSPAVRLESDWSRHGFALVAGLDVGRFASHPEENFVDGVLEASMTVEVVRSLRLAAAAGVSRRHEERGSVDGDGGVEPVSAAQWAVRGAAEGENGRFGYTVGAEFVKLDYDDVAAVGGGTLNQDDRDRSDVGVFGRAGYRVLPDGGVFVAGRYGLSDFAAATDDNGVNRDSRSLRLVAGAELDFGGITFGQAYAGWFREDFDDAALRPTEGVIAGAEVTVNVTPLTTVTLRSGREVASTVTAGASALVQDEAKLSIDHELLRNLIVSVALAGRRLAFRGIDRRDNHWAAGFGADWLVNRYARLRLHYDFDMRHSRGEAAVDGWRHHVVGLNLVLQR